MQVIFNRSLSRCLCHRLYYLVRRYGVSVEGLEHHGEVVTAVVVSPGVDELLREALVFYQVRLHHSVVLLVLSTVTHHPDGEEREQSG